MANHPFSSRILLALGTSGLLLSLFSACSLTRAGYETAAYHVVDRPQDGIEIRQYESLTVASTPMKGSRDEAENSGFRRLFRYISGDNAEGDKIAMTTPVLMSEGFEGQTMNFVLPRAVAEAGAPQGEAGVKVRILEAGPFAAIRLRGSRSAGKEKEAIDTLMKWAEASGVAVEGKPIVAGYDPPFTPAILQRNEVLIRLAQLPAETKAP